MGNLTNISKRLDELYNEQKGSKSQLSGVKTKEAAKLLTDMSLEKEASASAVAGHISKFSADVSAVYFDCAARSGNIPMDRLDDILRELLILTGKDTARSLSYATKLSSAVTSFIRSCQDMAGCPVHLSETAAVISHIASRSDKGRNYFKKLIENTSGKIYALDYSKVGKGLLADMWNVTNAVYPDLSGSPYEQSITCWGREYGFINAQGAKGEDGKKCGLPSGAGHSETMADDICGRIKNDMEVREKEIISVITQSLLPLEMAVSLFEKEAGRSRELSVENARLRQQADEAGKRISELERRLQEADNALKAMSEERDSLAKKNEELDSKLKDAYSINSREASLEAQKIRAALAREFGFLHEDWLEYEKADLSEENYESLQVILKKAFRAIEKNGINFKENLK